MKNNKILFLVLAMFCISHKLFAQRLKRIYLEEYDYTLSINVGECTGTFSDVISGNRKIKINLLNCKGKMEVKCYDNNAVLLESGSYMSSLDLLKRYVNEVWQDPQIPGSRKTSIGVDSYYQPLRDGVWYFYKSGQKIYMKKNYQRGILVDSVMVK